MKKQRKLLLLASLTGLLMTTANAGTLTASAEEKTPCVHEYKSEVVTPTCLESGYTEYTCTLCDEKYRDNFLEAKAHQYSKVVVPATCTTQGFTTNFCEVCGYQYFDNYTSATGHDYTAVEHEPMCTELGYTEHTCKNCKESYKDAYIQNLGHEYEQEVVEPTCSTDGYTQNTCSRCGDEYKSEEVKSAGHSYGDNKVLATCVTYGFVEHICSTCNGRYVTDYVKPRGHEYKDIIVPATEDELGYTKHVCESCNHTYLSDFVSSKDNGYIEVPKEPEPPVHKHGYTLSVVLDKEQKQVIVDFVCECGEQGKDLVTLLFANETGEIVTRKPIDGKVSYAEFTGELAVTAVDDYGNVLKEFSLSIEKEEIEEDNKDDEESDIPSDDGGNVEEHVHIFQIQTQVKTVEKQLYLQYKCACGIDETGLLRVTFVDVKGEEIVYAVNSQGILTYEDLTFGTYDVTVRNDRNELLSELMIEVPFELEVDNGSEDKKEPDQQEKEEKGNSVLPILLIVLFVLGAAGGVTFYFIKKSKSKSNNHKK